MAENGFTIIENLTGKTVYLNRSQKNSDPWKFCDENGVPGVDVSTNFEIEADKKVQMTAGAMSVEADEGPNFFARFVNSDDPPFEQVLIYCSGEKDEVVEYFFLEKAGKP